MSLVIDCHCYCPLLSSFNLLDEVNYDYHMAIFVFIIWGFLIIFGFIYTYSV